MRSGWNWSMRILLVWCFTRYRTLAFDVNWINHGGLFNFHKSVVVVRAMRAVIISTRWTRNAARRPFRIGFQRRFINVWNNMKSIGSLRSSWRWRRRLHHKFFYCHSIGGVSCKVSCQYVKSTPLGRTKEKRSSTTLRLWKRFVCYDFNIGRFLDRQWTVKDNSNEFNMSLIIDELCCVLTLPTPGCCCLQRCWLLLSSAVVVEQNDELR